MREALQENRIHQFRVFHIPRIVGIALLAIGNDDFRTAADIDDVEALIDAVSAAGIGYDVTDHQTFIWITICKIPARHIDIDYGQALNPVCKPPGKRP